MVVVAVTIPRFSAHLLVWRLFRGSFVVVVAGVDHYGCLVVVWGYVGMWFLWCRIWLVMGGLLRCLGLSGVCLSRFSSDFTGWCVAGRVSLLPGALGR